MLTALDLRRMGTAAIISAVNAGETSVALALQEADLRPKTGGQIRKAFADLATDETIVADLATLAERKVLAKTYFGKAFAAAETGKLKAGKTAYKAVMSAASVDAAKRAGRAAVKAAKEVAA